MKSKMQELSASRIAGGVVLAALVAGFIVSQSERTESFQFQGSNSSQVAINRCEQELQYRMGRDVGGREPDAWVDERTTQVSQPSNNETNIKGSGRFTRDANDRGRQFSFECSVNMRSGAVRANYRWTGAGFGGQYPDPGYEDTRPGRGAGRGGYPPSGRVFFSGGIVSRLSGKCLDVEGRSNRDAANVQQWSCSGGSNQLWDVIDLGRGQFSIVSQGSNKVLDVVGASTQDGASVQQYRWGGGDNQRWRVERVGDGAYRIVNVGSGLCLDVQGAKREDGANIQQWSCSGGANQAWLFRK
jgi:hypothetical protein